MSLSRILCVLCGILLLCNGLISSTLLAGGTTWTMTGDTAGTRLGDVVAGGSDLTGDGIADFVIAAPNATTTEVGAGKVLVFAGSATGALSLTPIWTLNGTSAGEELGASVALGDVNGDSIADLVIGAPGASTGGASLGSVGVFFGPLTSSAIAGSLSVAQWSVDGPHAGSRFGETVCLGELNEDGILDLIVGAPQADVSGVPTGTITAYLGGNSPTLDGVFQGIRPGGAFGAALSSSKMAPGSVVVGAPLVSNSVAEAGAAYLLTRLSPGNWELRWWIEGAAAAEHLGRSVAGPADLDGDGSLELFVGAPDADGGRGRIAGYTDLTGLSGGASTPNAIPPRWNLIGAQLGEEFGAAISIVESVDDDPRLDFVVGAPMFDNGSIASNRAGRAFVVTGRRLADSSFFAGAGIPQNIEQVSVWSYEGNAGELGRSVAGVGDVNGDGIGDFLLGAPVQSGTFADSGLAELHSGFHDCNENAIPDSTDLLFTDCNSNGVLDDCEPDCDFDLIPDDCEDDCDGDGTPDDCEEPKDCNENGLHDDCEIAGLLVTDCDHDLIPDDCEPDCDHDLTPDDCEPDCDGDGIPDDCEEDEDCNGNGLHDDCEMALHPEDDCNHNSIHDDCEPDCDQDGIPDDCEEPRDCNHNLIHDDCEPDCDGDGVPDDCELDCDGDGYPSDCDLDETCIDQLDCSSVDPYQCVVTLTWVNGGTFDEIKIFRNGHLVVTLPGSETTATVDLPSSGESVQICLVPLKDGQAGATACCMAECPAVPPQPENLVCNLTDPCTCEISLSWTNPSSYDAIQIFLNGMLSSELPGNTTMATVNITSDISAEICIKGVQNQIASLPTCCSATCPSVMATEPAMVDCGMPDQNCLTTVSWQNTSSYSEIRVKINGVLAETLPGNATSVEVVLPLPGTNQVCVEATTICGDPTPTACCMADCQQMPLAPQDLQCSLTDACLCTGELTWTNPVSYDSIRIFVDGVPLPNDLPGNATSASVTVSAGSASDFCVVGISNQVPSLEACCQLECPSIAPSPPEQFNCPEPQPGSPNCQVTLSWQNAVAYNEIVVLVDNVEVQVLSGDTTTATVILPAPTMGAVPIICLEGTTVCGDPFPQVCCFGYVSDCDGDGIPNFCENDCDGDGTPDDCEVAPDCNGNQIPDECDIADGTELDCNGNGVPDSCDIATGSSDDADMDGVPDECATPLTAASFIRGDCNGDQSVALSDAVDLLGWLFAAQGTPLCAAAGDATGDGSVQLVDVIYLLQYLFAGGAAPPPPFPACGSDISSSLDCTVGAHCP